MATFRIGDEEFTGKEVGAALAALRSEGGAVYLRMMRAVKGGLRDLLLSDLSETETQKARGGVSAIDGIGDGLLKQLSDWHAILMTVPTSDVNTTK